MSRRVISRSSTIPSHLVIWALHLLPVAMILMIGTAAVRRYWNASEALLGRVLSTEASRYLRASVSIGDCTIRSTGISLSAVTIETVPYAAQEDRSKVLSAKRIEAPFDSGILNRWRRDDLPLLSNVRITGLRGTLIREPDGTLNWVKMLPKSEGPPGRRWIGSLSLDDGAIRYADHALLRGRRSDEPPIQTQLRDLTARIQFENRGDISWIGSGAFGDPDRGRVSVYGRWESSPAYLTLGATLKDATLPMWINRVLSPNGVRIRSGQISGTGMLAWDFNDRATALRRSRWSAEAEIQNVRGRIPWSPQPALARRVTVQIADERVVYAAEGEVGRVPIRLRGQWRAGTDSGYAIALSTSGARLRDLDRAAPRTVADRIRAVLVEMDGRAAGQITVRKVRNRVALSGTVELRGRGQLVNGLRVVEPALIRADLTGTVDAPRVQFVGRTPSIAMRGAEFQRVRLAGRLIGDRAYLQGDAVVAGGTVYVNGAYHTAADRRFDGVLQARGVRVAQMHGILRDTGLMAPAAGGAEVSGRLSADARLRMSRDPSSQRGDLIVQVYKPKYDNIEADRLEVRAQLDGAALTVDRALLQDGDAVCVAQGAVDIRRGSVDIRLEADGLPLRRFAAVSNRPDGEDLSGIIDLRDGRISGDWSSPTLEGVLYGYGLKYEDWDVDYATAFVQGQPRSIAVDAEVVRWPSVLTAHGLLRRPFDRPWLTLSADAKQLELGLLARRLDLQSDVIGLASASALVNGPASSPSIADIDARCDDLWLDELHLSAVRATANAKPSDGIYGIELSDASADLYGGEVRAHGAYSFDGQTRLSVRAAGVPLEPLGSLWKDYADVAGSVAVDIEAEGRVVVGEAPTLRGSAAVNTTELTLNDEPLGSLQLGLRLDGHRITGGESVEAGSRFRIEGATGRLALENLTYDIDTRQGTLSGTADDVSIGAIRRALSRMPIARRGGTSGPSRQIVAALTPIEGSLASRFTMQLRDRDIQVYADAASSSLRIGDVPVEQFTLELASTRDRLDIRNLTGISGDMAVNGSGFLQYGEEIGGTLAASGIDLGLVTRWLAPTSRFGALKGAIDSVNAEISGSPEAPIIRLDASARDVLLEQQDTGAGSGPAFVLPGIRVIGATIMEGELRIPDVAVTIASRTGASYVGTPVELHANGTMPFHWEAPYIPENARAEIELRLPEQSLETITALAPQSGMVATGKAGGQVTISGSLDAYRLLATGELDDPKAIDVHGQLRLVADRVRFGRLRTGLGNVDMVATIQDGKVGLKPSSSDAPMAQLIRADGDTVIPSGGIYVIGSLPIVQTGEDSDGLRITANSLTFDEAPIPGFATGRLVGMLSGGPGVNGVDLSITGAVLSPHIAGTVALRDTTVRMPATEALLQRSFGPGIIDPTFDLSANVGPNVRVTNSRLDATMATRSGAPIRLTGSLSQPRLTGSNYISAGTLSFPTARFTIAPGGRVDLRYPAAGIASPAAAGLEVAVDLRASARMTARSVTGATRRYRVTVDAQGPLLTADTSGENSTDSRLRLSFRADPPDLALSQAGLAQKVTALLGGQSAIEAVFNPRGDTGTALIGQAMDYLGGALLPDVMDRLGLGRSLGLDEFSMDYSRAGAFVLRLSRNLIGPFEASYWRRISGADKMMAEQGEWEFRLSARLSSGFRLSWSLDDRQANAYLLEGVYSF